MATTSLSGVASFNSTDFTISTTGHVRLISSVVKTDDPNTFTEVQIFNAGMSAAGLSASRVSLLNVSLTGGITAGSQVVAMTNPSPYIRGNNTNGTLNLDSLMSGAAIPTTQGIKIIGRDEDLGDTGEVTIYGYTVAVDSAFFQVTGNQTVSGTLRSNGMASFPSGMTARGATFNGPLFADAGLTAKRINVQDTLTIPFQSVGNTAQRMNIGVYGSVSETSNSSALIWGNSVAASKQSLAKVEKTTFDIGHFVKMRYDTGVSIHTNITGAAGTEYGETQNTRLLVNLDGNVGINTTSPTTKLDVNGGISGNSLFVAGGITFGSVSSTISIGGSIGSNGQVLMSTGSGITWGSASGSGISRSISSISTDTSAGSASATDYVYIATAGLTLTMPTAVSNTNLYTVKSTTTSTVNIVTTSSQTIDGATGYYLNKQYQAIGLVSDGSNWSIV